MNGEDAAAFDTTVDTRAFGQVDGRVEIPLDDEGMVDWVPHLTFPGLAAGEELDRITRVGRAGAAARPRRHTVGRRAGRGANIPARGVRAGDRRLGGHRPRESRRASSIALGYSTEHAHRHQRPRAGVQPGTHRTAERPAPRGARIRRRCRRADPRQRRPGAGASRSRPRSIPDIQSAAVSALGGTYGGVAVLDARNGDVLGVAGLAFSNPQAPGSTFKVLTATAALEAGKVKPSDTFPVEISNSLIGREISNAHDCALRRHLRPELRAVLQHGVRAARSRGRRRRDARDGRAVRVQLRADARGAGRPGGAGAARELLPQAGVGRRARARARSARAWCRRRRCRWLRPPRPSPTRACASRPRW